MKKIHNLFQNTHCRTTFEDLKVNRLTIKFKIKIYIDKQLLLVTKLECKVVSIISWQLITCFKSPIENTRKRWEGCSNLTIKTLGQHHLTVYVSSFLTLNILLTLST